MEFASLRFYPWQLLNKALMKVFAGVVVALLLSCLSDYCLADPTLSARQSAEDWEYIAKIRSQIATDHDSQGNRGGRKYLRNRW